jgi:hypothetical protein
MNLGLMAIAANAGLDADRRQKVFDYEQKKRESELSLLDDRIDADRSGYQFNAAKNRVGLGLVSDPEYAKTMKAKQQTNGIRASLGLADAQNDQENQPKTLQLKNNKLQGDLMESNADLDALPRKLQQAAVQGALSDEAQRSVVRGTIGNLLASNNKDAAIRFANQIAQMPNVLPNTNGKPIADFKTVKQGEPMGADENGQEILAPSNGVLFVTNDGQAHFNPAEAMIADMSKMKSGDYAHVVSNDGTIGMYDKKAGPGSFKTVHQGDHRAARAQHAPAEVQTMEWLISKGVAKTPEAAWELVRSAREKNRNAFIMDYVGKSAGIGLDPNKTAAEAGRIYDELRQSQGPVNPAAPKPPAIDPKISDLLGIPVQ